MQLNHLHLHVDDLERARAFYERWFGLRELWREETLLFVGDGSGFEFALMEDRGRTPLPRWFHLGFKLGAASHVRDLYGAMAGAGVEMRETLGEEPGMTWFKCEDPDGHGVEVYWEAPR